MRTTNRLHGYSVDRTFARTEERKVTRLNREEYLRSKEEHIKRENVELASEEEITNMAAEDESILEPLCAPKKPNWGLHQLLHQSEVLHLLEPMSATVGLLRNLFWLKLQEVLDTKSLT